MDEQIIISAYHEAGHAIAAYIVGWSIHSITLKIENEKLLYAVTKYNFGDDVEPNTTNLTRRIFSLLGGPISESLHKGSKQINLDTLGPDGSTIDTLLSHLASTEKAITIENLIKILVSLFQIPVIIDVINKIANYLISNNFIDENEFLKLSIICSEHKINFNS